MTARIVGIGGSNSAGSVTSYGIAPPTPLYRPYTVVDGQLLVGLNGWDGNSGTITPPTGFAAVSGITNGPEAGNAVSLGCFTKTASSESPASAYGYSWVNSEFMTGIMLAVDGHNGVNIAAAADGNSTAPQAPSVTTTVDDCLIIQGFVIDMTTAAIQPITQNDGTYTLGSVFNLVGPIDGGRCAIYGGTRRQGAAGSTGTFTFAVTGGALRWRAFTIAIAPLRARAGMSAIEVGG